MRSPLWALLGKNMKNKLIFVVSIIMVMTLSDICAAKKDKVEGEGTSRATVTIDYGDKKVEKTHGIAAQGASYKFVVKDAPGGSKYDWDVTPKTEGKWTHSGMGTHSTNTFTPYIAEKGLDVKYSFTVTVHPKGEGGGDGKPWSVSGTEILNDPTVAFTDPDPQKGPVDIAKLADGTFNPATQTVTVKATNPFKNKALSGLEVYFEVNTPAIGTVSPTKKSTAGSGVAATIFTPSEPTGDTTIKAKCGRTEMNSPKITIFKLEKILPAPPSCTLCK